MSQREHQAPLLLCCPCKNEMSDMQWWQCRGFTNPFRKLSRKLAPNSALAKEFSSRLANLHSIWHQIMTDVLASAPTCAPTCSHFFLQAAWSLCVHQC